MLKTALEQVRSGAVSAQERTQVFLERIQRDNPTINAILSINPQALDEAKTVDQRRAQGKPLGRLAGAGIVVKSNINVKGLSISCASKVLENYIGTYDAEVIKRIRAQDGVILGMANCDEFACGSSGENSAFGPTQNPAAPGRIPGGSSSGSAAALAAGWCDIALGSETGGSIRNPASHCGVVGYKPSYGLVSRHGLIDLSMSLDAIGPLAADVEGISAMMEVISGGSSDAKVQGDFKPSSAHLKGASIGMAPVFQKMCSDARIYELVRKSVDALDGVKIKELTLPYIDLAVQTYYPLVYVELFSGTRKFDGKKYGLPIEEHCGEEVLRRILGGREISRAEHQGRYYRLALKARELISRHLNAALEQVDVLALPVTPKLPHKLGERIETREEYAYDAFTIPANLAGCCAISIPAGKIDGVPVGMQLMAKSFNDAKLLAIAREVHDAIR